MMLLITNKHFKGRNPVNFSISLAKNYYGENSPMVKITVKKTGPFGPVLNITGSVSGTQGLY